MGTIVSCLIFIALWLVQFGVKGLLKIEKEAKDKENADKFYKINKRRKENATI